MGSAVRVPSGTDLDDSISFNEPTPVASKSFAQMQPVSSVSGSANPSPEIFDIASGELPCESSDLNLMFSFGRAQVLGMRRCLPDIPLATDEFMSDHMPKTADPFAFVAEHVDLLKG